MKFICKACLHSPPCVLDIGNIELPPESFACPKKIAKEDCKWEKLPKLTAEVFDRPDCPQWAKYALVGRYGNLVFIDVEPHLADDGYMWTWRQDARRKITPELFDASDWQNSLIERPKKKTLPEWVKCGEWAYGEGRYGKITAINHTDGKIDIGEKTKTGNG